MSSPTRFNPMLFARSLVGLILAPVVGGALAMMVFVVPDAASSDFDPGDFAALIIFGGLYGGMFGVIPALLIGWPVHLVLLRQRWTQVWVYMGIGTVLGVSALFGTSLLMEAWGNASWVH